MQLPQKSKNAMHKAFYTHCMYGGSTVSPWNGDIPTEGYMVERSDLSDTEVVRSCYNPAMGGLDIPCIEVPRQAFSAEFSIVWTMQMKSIMSALPERVRPTLYVGTWDNKNGEVEIDVTQCVEDLDEAKAKAKALRQRAIFDIKNNKHIYL